METVKINDNFYVLSFAEARQPVYSEAKGRDGGYVKFGENNDYASYLLDLFNKSPKHGAIIKGKVTYIIGNSWVKPEDSDTAAKSFIDKANRKESLHEIAKKCCTDLEIFGGYYLEIIWSVLGDKIAEIYHLDYLKVRTNEDNTQFWYRDEWNGKKQKSEIRNAFNPAYRKGSQVLYVKEYRPGVGAYALPGYLQANNMIEADIEVSKHVLGNAQTGFNPSKHIAMMEDPGSETTKGAVEKKFKAKYTGAAGQKVLFSWVKDPNKTPKIEDLGTSDMTKEDFGPINNLIQQEIFTAHLVTSPMLFGIKTEGQLGGRSELLVAYEIFKSTYGNEKQHALEQVFNMLAKYKGVTTELTLQPLDPISSELSEATIAGAMSQDEIREKAGLPKAEKIEKPAYQLIADALAALPPLAATKVLESLTNDEIRGLAGLPPSVSPPVPATEQQMSEVEDSLKIFEAFGVSRSSFETLRSRSVTFDSDEDLIYDEETKAPVAIKLAQQSLSALEKKIIDLISKDELISPETLAKTLETSEKLIGKYLKSLEDAGLLKVTSKDGQTVRKLTKAANEINSISEIDLQVMYSYEGPKDSKNRPFCAKLLELDRLYSRADIETMSAQLGYSVFDRCGGWYTIPSTGEHRPRCRHTWKSNVVVRNDG